jgi:hypothetical protein
MTRVLSRVPVAIAADASGVIVTVNQLGIVGGVATFGTLYLNLAGHLPASARASALTSAHGSGLPSALASAHAYALTSAHAYEAAAIALAALAIVGGVLAAMHVGSRAK